MTDNLSLAVGAGRVDLSPADGAPLQFVDPQRSPRRFLLDEQTDGSHSPEHRWGSGFLISSAGSSRWSTPDSLQVDDDAVRASFDLATGLSLAVERSGGDRLTERYRLTNTTAEPITVTSLGINTPFRDVYDSAAESLSTAVHAHVWTGGHDAWVWAQPMSGEGWSLGLVVREGGLWSYSVESRNSNSSSNTRGHLLLHPTDLARNAAAFGGQPELRIEPGDSWTLAWDLAFYSEPDRPLPEPVEGAGIKTDRLYAEVGQSIKITGGVSDLRADGDAGIEQKDDHAVVTGSRHGLVHLATTTHQTAVLFHLPLPELVRRRVRFILDHHRPTERPAPYAYAFVPYDTATGLTQTTNGWSDWSDGAERLAMPTLLQEARRRGWVDSTEEVDKALSQYAEFARTQLLDETAAPRWGSMIETDVRIYNSPWLAHFFATAYELGSREDDLDLAARILERSFELGAGEHLSIGHPEAALRVADLMDAVQPDRATELRTLVVSQADHFRQLGVDLPSHEVNYEQSMVAPLVTLYALAEQVEQAGRFLTPLQETLRWLRAFGGPQPHIRLNNIGIRHWDGFWFGRDRQWGDTFPHHWSVLTAVALRQLPAALRTEESDAAAEQILHANLLNIFDDGSATCAFVLPSAVDGRPAYRADALANDQDWPLTLWLRLLS